MPTRRLSAAIRRLSGGKGGAYDPVSYWNKREDPNAAKGIVPERVEFDASYIRANLTPGDRLLELGPGVGRTFGSYSPGTNISTLDIARIYEDKLAEVAVEADLVLDQHFMDDTSKPFPFSDNEFDVGVCFQVFMHQPPEVFRNSFAEFARVCRRCIVSVAQHANSPHDSSGDASHVFRHDYLTGAGKIGKIVNNVIVRDQVLYFTLEDDTGNLWLGGETAQS